jgi:hypothetical protein
MRRFTLGVAGYLLLCLVAAVVIVLRGDGPSPRIVSLYPFNGDRYWPGGTAQITFSQSMDEGSVERALQVSPGSQGQGAWYGNTLNLQPVGDWRPETTYHVELVGKVVDTEGRPLHTPLSFWFRVHHVGRLGFCTIHGVRNICEPIGSHMHPLTQAVTPILAYQVSSDGSMLAFTRRDSSGLPHLFVEQVDGTGLRQLTHGKRWADSHPFWAYGNSSSVTYYRQPVHWQGRHYHLGRRQIWNVNVDGSNNARL